MEFDQLRTFLAVLDHGSFSRAAVALHLGQSTVSFHIKALETGVGTRLLDRHGGRVRPTSSGRLLRRYAERILTLREEAMASLRAEETGESGSVVVAASTIPAEFLLPPVLAVLRRARPGVRVTVAVSDSRKAAATLLAQECDLALVGALPPDKRVVSVPFAHDEIVLAGPCPNPFAPDGRLEPEALGRTPLILREEGSGTRDAAAPLLAFDSGPFARGPLVQVGSTEAARRCVLEGLGLTFISRWAVEEDIAAGRVCLVELPGVPVRRELYALYLRSVSLSPAAEALLDALLQHFRCTPSA